MPSLNQRPFFPYPAEWPEKIGFLIGDLVLVGLVIMSLVMLYPTFTR